jgi:hypothetical protein
LQQQRLGRDQLLVKLGAAKQKAGNAFRLVDLRLPPPKEAVTPETFTFALNKEKLRQARRREGNYLLRSNLRGENPAKLWEFYVQLTEVEQAFKNLKNDLEVRPIYHQKDQRIEAHILLAFLAYCLHVTLRQRLRALAPGLTSREVLDKFSQIQMLDVHIPTTDGRELLLSRYTQPEKDQRMLLQQLHLNLPDQPPPKITSKGSVRPSGN